MRGLHREPARHLVDRGGDREDDVLAFEQVVRKAMVPGPADMAQIAGTGVQGRNARDLRRGAPGQDGRRAVNAGVRKPALSAGDQPSGDLGSQLPRECADDRFFRLFHLSRFFHLPAGIVDRSRLPGEDTILVGQLAAGRMVAHGSEQGVGRDLSGGYQLVDRKDLERRLWRLVVGIGDDRMGSSEIDTDGVTGHCWYKYSQLLITSSRRSGKAARDGGVSNTEHRMLGAGHPLMRFFPTYTTGGSLLIDRKFIRARPASRGYTKIKSETICLRICVICG